MQHKVSELEGALLDAAVAKADGMEVSLKPGNPMNRVYLVQRRADGEIDRVDQAFLPSREWAQGGPIIERERIAVSPGLSDTDWWARGAQRRHTMPIDHRGPTPLIAAMRSFVFGKFGETVELP